MSTLRESTEGVVKFSGVAEDRPVFALVTGASSGIGKAIAKKLAVDGWNLCIVALPDTDLESYGKYLADTYGVQVKCITKDLTDPTAPQELYDECTAEGMAIKVLVNNAGFGNAIPFADTEVQVIQRMMQLNMHAVVSLCRLFIPSMKQFKEAYILNVGSTASFFPVPYKSIYSATKNFVLSFSNSLRIELLPNKIFVSCLCPGPTETNAATIARLNSLGWKARMFSLSADEVAAIAIRRLFRKKSITIPGRSNRMGISFGSMLPRSLVLLIFELVFRNGMDKKQADTSSYAKKEKVA